MSKEFWKDTGYRCAWTFAQALLGYITVGQAVTDVNWAQGLSVAFVAALACFLKQIVKHFKGMTVEQETASKIAKEMDDLCDYVAEYVEEPEDSEVIEDEE